MIPSSAIAKRIIEECPVMTGRDALQIASIIQTELYIVKQALIAEFKSMPQQMRDRWDENGAPGISVPIQKAAIEWIKTTIDKCAGDLEEALR